MNPFYKDYSEYLRGFFGDKKIQKISVNTGNGCPNRDGSIGTGGCIYCRNDAFTPGYCMEKSDLMSQIDSGKKFFSRKYPDMHYLVYFQSYTGTYGLTAESLGQQLKTVISSDKIVGVIIGTRPDCLPEDVLKILSEFNLHLPVFVELGIETSHDDTLCLINRGHTWQQSKDAILKLSEYGLHTGVHLIAGLPGETTEMILETIDRVCALPVESIKLHHLQVLKGTPLSSIIEKGIFKIHEFDIDEYLDLCVNIIERIPGTIAIERFLASSPPSLVESPRWGLKNYEFTNLLLNKLKSR